MTTFSDTLRLIAVLGTLWTRTCITDAATLPILRSTCPVNCTCAPTQIICQDRIPQIVPDAVEEISIYIYVSKTHDLLMKARKMFLPGIFCNVTWPNVYKMSIMMIKDGNYRLLLHNDDFRCLERLTTLKMRFVSIFSATDKINLTGLINVRTLEIDDTGYLYNLLSGRQNFPNLVNITVYNDNGVILDNRLVSALSQRKIKVLNFSLSVVTFNFNYSATLCDSLSQLILCDSDIEIENIPLKCASLQYVDLSGVNYFVSLFKQMCLYRSIIVFRSTFFWSKALYLNKMFTDSYEVMIPSCEINFLNNQVKNFYFSQNALPRFEIRFIDDDLEYINLSHNMIETIHQDTFRDLPACRNIDLSFNNLHFMGIPEGVFSYTLGSDRLNVIDLSSNNISDIAEGLFDFTINLEKIKLSKNRLTQINFNISHLHNLVMLDLRFNDIQNLGSNSRKQLQELYKAQQQRQTITHINVSLAILLEGNPFSCSCDYKEFVQWFAKSPVFDNTRHTQHCQFHQQKYTLDHSAISVATDDCERAARELKIILLSTILSVISVGIISIAIITIYRRRKRRLQKHRYEDRLRLVQENRMDFKFPVFLSYSSLDLEFVVNHVRHPLQRHLQAITQADRDLVCDADIHFIPGHNIYQEMSRCIDESAVFVAVISKNYCKSDHCQIEIAEARTTGKPILLIFKEHVEEDTMKIVIKEIFHNFTRVKFVEEEGEYRIQPGWEQVCESIIEML